MLDGFDSHYKLMPPLRNKEQVAALRAAVLDGTIDMVTSDHNPLNIELKQVEFDHAAYGSIGLESAFGALNSLLAPKRPLKYSQPVKNVSDVRYIRLKKEIRLI